MKEANTGINIHDNNLAAIAFVYSMHTRRKHTVQYRFYKTKNSSTNLVLRPKS